MKNACAYVHMHVHVHMCICICIYAYVHMCIFSSLTCVADPDHFAADPDLTSEKNLMRIRIRSCSI
jgi:hypothetical protein